MNETTAEKMITILAKAMADLQEGKITPQQAAATASLGHSAAKQAGVRVATARLAGVKPSGAMMRYAGLEG